MLTVHDEQMAAGKNRPATSISQDLLLIGEGLHVLKPSIVRAIEQRNHNLLVQFAQKQVNAGALALNVNLGPGRAMGRLTPWVLDTIRQAVDVPLFLSSGILTLPHLLEKHSGWITINAVTAAPEQLPWAMKTAQQHGADLVVLLVKPGLVPSGVDGRLQLAMEVLDEAEKTGLPLEQLYLDPVISCRPDPAAWEISHGMPEIGPVLEAITLIKELRHDAVKTIVGIGNSSQGLESGSRSALHCRLLPLLAEAGLDAVIMNCLDHNLMNVARAVKNGAFPAFVDNPAAQEAPSC